MRTVTFPQYLDGCISVPMACGVLESDQTPVTVPSIVAVPTSPIVATASGQANAAALLPTITRV